MNGDRCKRLEVSIASLWRKPLALRVLKKPPKSPPVSVFVFGICLVYRGLSLRVFFPPAYKKAGYG